MQTHIVTPIWSNSDGSVADEITSYLITDNFDAIASGIKNSDPKIILNIGSGKLKNPCSA